jgi:Predicted Zn-dependent hydrolases of the beta-lactamase fold
MHEFIGDERAIGASTCWIDHIHRASSSNAIRAAPIRVTWLGHAAFEVVSPTGTRLLIDPWIGDNPATPAAFKDSTRYSTPARDRMRLLSPTHTATTMQMSLDSPA